MNRSQVPLIVSLVFLLLMAVGGTAFAQGVTTVTIQPTGASGVSGSATLTAKGGSTTVTLELKGFPPNTVHPTHFHVGTCNQPGQPVIPLPNLVADGQGVARATTDVNVAMTALMDGNHLVMTHVGPPPMVGPGIACGDIPRLAAAVRLPRAGGPGIIAGALATAFALVIFGGLLKRGRIV